MRTVQLPFGEPVYRNIDNDTVLDVSNRIVDGFIDEAGAVRKRPGMKILPAISLSAYSALGSSANRGHTLGIFSAPAMGQTIWIAAEQTSSPSIYLGYVTGGDSGSEFAVDTSTTVQSISDIEVYRKRCTFAEDGSRVYFALGLSDISSWAGSTLTSLTDADAPDSPEHIAIVDGALVALDPATQTFNWSSFTDRTAWDATDTAQAVGKGDILIALRAFQRELLLFGRKTLEIWENDGVTPFSRIPGGFFETGCAAEYSIVNTDLGIYWLGNDRRFYKYSSGAPTPVGAPYDKEIQAFDLVSDCTGDRINILGQEFLVFSFPAEKRTLVYNVTTDSWSEWGYWRQDQGLYEHWPVAAYGFDQRTGRHLVGSRINAALYELKDSHYEDTLYSSTASEYIAPTTNPIRLLQRTGWLNFGTHKRKKSREVRLYLKRGALDGQSEGALQLRWRDDGNRNWSNWLEIDLGDLGENIHVVKLYPRGIFRERQYELSCSDAVPVMWQDGEEDLEVLDR